MANFDEEITAAMSFFHTRSKTLIEESQNIFESSYKSQHTVRSNDVWNNVIFYCSSAVAADNEALSNTAVTKYTLQSLTEVPGSNGQSWELVISGTKIRNWISPIDILHSTTRLPSYGFQAKLYDSSNNIIHPTVGSWFVDYYGIVKFAEGYTPSDLGYGTPKVTCYVYSGAFIVPDYVKAFINNPLNRYALNTNPLN